MGELVTRYEKSERTRNDIKIYGQPIELEKATEKQMPHAVVFVLLIRRKDTQNTKQTQFYLQRRAASKSLYPNLLTVSASGRIRHGESVMQAARRETLEELGVKIKKAHLLAHVPLILNPAKPFHLIFPVLAVAKRNPKPNKLEVNEKGSKYYSSQELIEELKKQGFTPPALNFFKTLAEQV